MNDPIKWLETSLLAIAAFNLFVLSARVLFSFKQFQPANAFLLGWLFITGTAISIMYLVDTGLIIKLPWLYRLPSPLYYLFFPFAYFYIRLMLADKTALSKWDLIHLLPALLHLFEMLPFYFLPGAYKVEIILNTTNNPLEAFTHDEGILPRYLHNIFRGLQGIGYAFAMFLLLNNKRHKKNEHLLVYPEIRKWLKAFTWIQFLLGLIIIIFLGFPQLAPPDARATYIYIFLALIQSGASVLLFFNPIILYGIPKFSKEIPVSAPFSEVEKQEPTILIPEDNEIDEVAKSAFKPFKPKSEKEELIIKKLENLINTNKPFLKTKLSASEIATQLEIPLHHLSYILNHVMCVKFTDYINEKRIGYMEEKIKQEGLRQYTLEALALASGFNSRVTFIRAVKKIKGQNPSDYFKRVESEEPLN